MTKHCKISKEGIFINGLIQDIEFDSSQDWKKQLFKLLEIDYPKFYKMDALSKMSILTIELLKKEVDFDIYKDDEVSLVFNNSLSSSYTDLKFINSYTNSSNPSPSLFVYTLPNIATGELAIYMKWFGESIFFIQTNFYSIPLTDILEIESKKGVKASIVAWVEKSDKTEECFLLYHKHSEHKINQEEIIKSYNKKA